MNASHSTSHSLNRIGPAILAVLLLVSLAAPMLQAHKLLDDDDIYDQVNRKLNNDSDIHGRIKIDVKNGVVTLTGNVGTEKVRSKAEKIVRKVQGVKDVVNKLEVGDERPK
jgi:osmotically-inducible protein OsmY